MNKKTFKDLLIGQAFKFYFDLCSEWEYEKVSENQVKCINAPKTESGCVGRIEPYRHEWSEVKLP